jgi:hypothetical protein
MMRSMAWKRLAALLLLAAGSGCTGPGGEVAAGFRSPEVLAAVLPLRGDARALHAANFLALLARERGSPEKAAAPELAALVPRIVESLRTGGFEVSLTLALGVLGGGEALEHLLDRVEESRHEPEFGAVAGALAMIRDPAALQALRRLCRHSDAGVRVEAMAAIATTADEGATGILVDGLEDEEARVRWSAAIALALHRGSGAGKGVLHRMLDRRHVEEGFPAGVPDRAGRVNRAIQTAAAALVSIRDETAIEPLRAASMDDPDPRVRGACRDAMEALLIPPDREPGRIHRGQ